MYSHCFTTAMCNCSKVTSVHWPFFSFAMVIQCLSFHSICKKILFFGAKVIYPLLGQDSFKKDLVDGTKCMLRHSVYVVILLVLQVIYAAQEAVLLMPSYTCGHVMWTWTQMASIVCRRTYHQSYTTVHTH